jgi:hypothetical protein
MRLRATLRARADVTPSLDMRKHIIGVQSSAFDRCGNKLHLYDSGRLNLRPGCDEKTTLEVRHAAAAKKACVVGVCL